MISIEAYRSAIGRFYGKAKKKERCNQPFMGITTSILKEYDWTLLFMMLYLITVVLNVELNIDLYWYCMEVMKYIGAVLFIIMIYCYPLMVVCISTDLLALTFQKEVSRKNAKITKKQNHQETKQ